MPPQGDKVGHSSDEVTPTVEKVWKNREYPVNNILITFS
ncbi:uncharacterized protein METZ01_LOCUS7233 [marine metagenome]|uniref:Uncharacterized protein n=1 Tax=marine metagenome TaxID=408172 RepID=A0A381NJ18_9ZZZZ